jgi:bifunctional UDP-N-acetylglucosamine pyrophosphorylase/glucosamine-1-phosphate N-acetyltransferase
MTQENTKASDRLTDSPLAVVVLAAGKGTRMKSALPKVMHPLAGRPMVLHVLDLADTLGAERSVTVLGPEMDALSDLVAPRPTVVQTERLGTGHALQQAMPALDGISGDVLVLYGDTPLLGAATLDAVLAARHGAGDPAIVVLGFRPEEPGGYGRLITAADGTVERIVEARDADEQERAVTLCNSGVMAIESAALAKLLPRLTNNNAKGEFYLTDLVALATEAGRGTVCVEAPADELLGINDRSELAVAEAFVQDQLRHKAMVAGVSMIDPATVWLSHDTVLGQDVVIGPNVVFAPGVTVGDGVEILAFSHLEGVTIAAGARIGPFARLRPGTKVGEGARIGNFVEVKATDVEPGAKISHLSYVGDARVGAGANIGAGTITCNYDGFTKSHTDIGAGAFIGSNTALVAPVKIGDGAMVGAGSTISEDVDADDLALTRAPHKNIEKGGATFRDRRRKES